MNEPQTAASEQHRAAAIEARTEAVVCDRTGKGPIESIDRVAGVLARHFPADKPAPSSEPPSTVETCTADQLSEPGWHSCLWDGSRHVFWWNDGRLWASPDDQRPLFIDDRCTDFVRLVPGAELVAENERLRDALNILAAGTDDRLHSANADLERYFERGLLCQRRDCTDEYVCEMTDAGHKFVRAALAPKGATP